MTTHFWAALLIMLSVCSMAALVKEQGHGKISLSGEIVETPCGIDGENVDQSVDFGLISMRGAAQCAQLVLVGSRRNVEIKLINCVLVNRVRPSLLYCAANITFDGIADSLDPELLGVYDEAQGIAIELLNSAGAPPSHLAVPRRIT